MGRERRGKPKTRARSTASPVSPSKPFRPPAGFVRRSSASAAARMRARCLLLSGRQCWRASTKDAPFRYRFTAIFSKAMLGAEKQAAHRVGKADTAFSYRDEPAPPSSRKRSPTLHSRTMTALDGLQTIGPNM